jgi:hypothetical protein
VGNDSDRIDDVLERSTGRQAYRQMARIADWRSFTSLDVQWTGVVLSWYCHCPLEGNAMTTLPGFNRPDFDAWYESQNKSLLHSARESHWETWQEAQRRAVEQTTKKQEKEIAE